MSNKEELFLKSNNFVPSKKMGQNFLVNAAVQKNLVRVAEIANGDNVLEIGPGLGAITKYILEITDQFIAIELDKRLYSFIKEHYPNLIIINNDILKVDLTSLFNQYNFKNVNVVANLPYSISSKIILKLVKCNYIKEINILVQKEMADRLLANVNTKEYNAFTVLISMFSDVKHLLKVNKHDFNPQPKVESSFIKIILKNKFNIDFDEIDKFLRICFSSKRKKLTNNLQMKYDKKDIIEALNIINMDENTRAENLTNEQFIRLYKKLSKVQND